MKFIQNKITKKLIISLIIILCLFNAVYPNIVFAIDIGGILIQPVYELICGIFIPADLILGSFLLLDSFHFRTHI